MEQPSMLEPFVRQKTILLTTYRRNGAPVTTPVNIAVEGGRAFIRTYDKAGKVKRIRNNPIVQIAFHVSRKDQWDTNASPSEVAG